MCIKCEGFWWVGVHSVPGHRALPRKMWCAHQGSRCYVLCRSVLGLVYSLYVLKLWWQGHSQWSVHTRVQGTCAATTTLSCNSVWALGTWDFSRQSCWQLRCTINLS